MSIKPIVTALAFAAMSFGASATTPTPAPTNTNNTLYGVTLGTGISQHLTFLGGVSADFSAFSGTNAAHFNTKPGQGGYQGIGVAGATEGEIDIGETIVGSFSRGIKITNFKIGLLFDGPEYGDVNEKAKISVTYAAGGTSDFYLTATSSTTASWKSALGVVLGPVVNKSAANGGDTGGVWSVSNPFGNALVTSITFGAATGRCGTAGGSCNNQSDYTFYSITAVPEPETYAMLLAGLAAVGAAVRRKKKQA